MFSIRYQAALFYENGMFLLLLFFYFNHVYAVDFLDILKVEDYEGVDIFLCRR